MSVGEDGLSPEQQAARDELHDLLQRHAKLLGPWDEDGDGQVSVPETVFVSEWVLMAAWIDENGVSWLTRIPSRQMAAYRRVGLLYEGLHGFDD